MSAANSWLVRVFERTTGVRATPRSAEAVSRFAPYLAGMFAAKAFSTAGQLVISRWLGPSMFGELAVVLSFSVVLALPLAGAWGNTFVRYAAGKGDSTWAPLLAWVTRRTLLASIGLALLLCALSPVLAEVLRISPLLVIAGAGLGVAMAAWLLAKAACQGREDWRRFIGAELGFGLATLFLPCLLLLFGGAQWWEAAAVFALAYLAGTGPAWSLFSRAARVRPHAHSPEIGLEASHYGRYALLTGAANTLFLYGDRFAAQHVLGSNEVGVYQLYNFATLGVAMLLSTMLHNFVFPLFPQGDRRAFAALFRSGFLRLLPLTLAALFVGGWLQIQLSGFPFRPGLLLVACCSAAAFMLSGFYGQLVLSVGVSGSRLTAKIGATTLVVFAVAVVPAVQVGGLGGLFALYSAIYLGLAAYLAQALRHLAAEQSRAVAAVSSLP